MGAGCFICDKQASGDAFGLSVIHDDALVFASHIAPGDDGVAYLGHVFVETKRHVARLGHLTDAEAAAVGRLVNDLSAALLDAAGAEHVYSHVYGDGVPHLHVHLVARYPGAPREYWTLQTKAWPGAPRGGRADVRELSAKLRDAVAERRSASGQERQAP